MFALYVTLEPSGNDGAPLLPAHLRSLLRNSSIAKEAAQV